MMRALMKYTLWNNLQVWREPHNANLAFAIVDIAHVMSAPGGFDAVAEKAERYKSGYGFHLRSGEKADGTGDDGFGLMLNAVHGVGEWKAVAIAMAYSSPAALVRAYDKAAAEGATEQEMDNMLKDLAVGSKRVGPATPKRVRRLFMKDSWVKKVKNV